MFHESVQDQIAVPCNTGEIALDTACHPGDASRTVEVYRLKGTRS